MKSGEVSGKRTFLSAITVKPSEPSFDSYRMLLRRYTSGLVLESSGVAATTATLLFTVPSSHTRSSTKIRLHDEGMVYVPKSVSVLMMLYSVPHPYWLEYDGFPIVPVTRYIRTVPSELKTRWDPR